MCMYVCMCIAGVCVHVSSEVFTIEEGGSWPSQLSYTKICM